MISRMSIGGSSIGRKGMSPLIATVLLMAFAVALGGMIMNWSIDTVTNGDCGSLKVQVNHLCTTDTGISLSVRNDKAGVTIHQIQVVFTQGGFENRLLIKDSALTPGQPLDNVQIPVTVASGTKVDLIGIVGNAPNTVTCSVPIYTSSAIQKC